MGQNVLGLRLNQLCADPALVAGSQRFLHPQTYTLSSILKSILRSFRKTKFKFSILICVLLLGSLSAVVQKSPQVSNYISQSFYTFDSVSYHYHFPPNSTAQKKKKRAVCYNYIVTTKNLPRLYKQKHKNISLK